MSTIWADECYQIAPERQRQVEYDRCSEKPEHEREAYFENVKSRLESGSYWADECYQLAGSNS